MRQELFATTTLNGTVVMLVRLDSQQCAIERDGDVIHTYTPDDAGNTGAIKRYFQTIDECGGAPHPFQAMDGLCHHPHAG